MTSLVLLLSVRSVYTAPSSTVQRKFRVYVRTGTLVETVTKNAQVTDLATMTDLAPVTSATEERSDMLTSYTVELQPSVTQL